MNTNGDNELGNRSILISGAGTAGQILGYWLHRYGFNPTIVERTPAPRTGGFAVDIRGTAVDIAERMGIMPACRAAHASMEEIIRYNAKGEVIMKTDGHFDIEEDHSGDWVEILRDDLTTILLEQACEGVEYIFNDSIVSLAQDEDGVDVTFERGAPRRFDLVIGADGLHSQVRSLAFGPADRFKRPQDRYFGIFTMANTLNLCHQWLIRHMPGKALSVLDYGPDKHTRGLMVFSTKLPLQYDRANLDEQKALIEKAFEGDTTWGVQILLEGLRASTDLYFDEVSQIHMDSWSNGRVSLVGDAVSAPTLLTGQGTSVAFVEAYVLAGELKAANGDYRIAFARYEAQARVYAEKNQRLIDCPEMGIPATQKDVDQMEETFRMLATAASGARDAEEDNSYSTLLLSAANAIEFKDYELA